ncbi:MAG: SGNH/GDSL hydrolase family protein [Candidatus Diapherotrites archaeon]|nr:SGNH/GDSL hydrolase family protein [Candidatus Diapherotrites archaeon]
MANNICIFGASTAFGYGDNEKGGWAERLKLCLREKGKGIVFNLGISGQTTKDVLKRIENESAPRKPKVIIIQVGDNDAIFLKKENKNKVPLEEFSKNLTELLKKAKVITKNVVVLSTKKVLEEKMCPAPWDKNVYYYNKEMEKYASEIKRETEKHACEYVDILNLLEEKDYFDGLHPNYSGHDKIFEKVKQKLEEKKFV